MRNEHDKWKANKISSVQEEKGYSYFISPHRYVKIPPDQGYFILATDCISSKGVLHDLNMPGNTTTRPDYNAKLRLTNDSAGSLLGLPSAVVVGCIWLL